MYPLQSNPHGISIASCTQLNRLPDSPTRANHTFVGWFNTSAVTGGTQIT